MGHIDFGLLMRSSCWISNELAYCCGFLGVINAGSFLKLADHKVDSQLKLEFSIL